MQSKKDKRNRPIKAAILRAVNAIIILKMLDKACVNHQQLKKIDYFADYDEFLDEAIDAMAEERILLMKELLSAN